MLPLLPPPVSCPGQLSRAGEIPRPGEGLRSYGDGSLPPLPNPPTSPRTPLMGGLTGKSLNSICVAGECCGNISCTSIAGDGIEGTAGTAETSGTTVGTADDADAADAADEGERGLVFGVPPGASAPCAIVFLPSLRVSAIPSRVAAGVLMPESPLALFSRAPPGIVPTALLASCGTNGSIGAGAAVRPAAGLPAALPAGRISAGRISVSAN